MEEKVSKFGKIRYVEPNDFLGDKTNNITHPQEDYSMYVDLLVKTVDRKGKLKSSDENVEILIGSTQKKTVSFFNGKDGFLNDTPSFITFKDIMNGEISNTNESLGITNIHITYNSYFYPEVTINFTDVRGAALMMPHEENYRREQVNNAKGEPVYSNEVKSFFNSLFSFPYPEFILRVKGFYGKMIEYSLLVTEFKSSFNNETGNFDATLKLIGKMYGVYTDIPMSYLLLAPYCRYGGINNRTIWESKNFLLDGYKMPTFLEIREKIKIANTNLSSVIDVDTVSKLTKINNEQSSLQEVLNYYDNLKKALVEKDDCFLINDNIFYFIEYGSFENYLKDINISIVSPFCNALKKHLDEYPNSITSIDAILTGKISSKNLNKEYYFEYDDDYNLVINKDFNDKIIKNKIHAYLKTKGYVPSHIYTLDCKSFYKSLENKEKELKKEEEKIKNLITGNESETLVKIFGFKPTIKNIFKIIMAHLDVFIEVYANFLSKVTGENTRKLTDYNINKGSISDINNTEKELPPFPAFINNETNEFCYPTPEMVNNKILEETELIESLVECIGDYKKELYKTNLLTDKENDLYLIPTCLTDFINRINPYRNLSTDKINKYKPEWFMTFFGMRCLTHFIFENRSDFGIDNANDFGKLEAYNFWVANKDLDEKLIKVIENNEFNDSNFISFLENKKVYNPYNSKNNPCYTYKNNNKLIFINNDKNIKAYISDNSQNFPMTIDRTLSYSYNNDIENNGWKYSYYTYTVDGGKHKHHKGYPYFYQNFVSENILNNFNTQLSNINIDDYVSDSGVTNVIVNKFIPYTSSLFSNRAIYCKEENNNFYNKVYEINYNENDEDEYNALIELGDSLNKFITGNNEIDKFLSYNDKNIFFEENLTAEDFLYSIPWNCRVIYNILNNGSTIFTLPYCVKLFIGMFLTKIDKLKEDEDKLKEYLKDISEKYYNLCCPYNIGKDSSSNRSKRIKFSYLYFILLITSFLTRYKGEFYENIKNKFKYKIISNNGNGPYITELIFNENTKFNEYDSYDEDSFFTSCVQIIMDNREPFSNDFLGLKDEYKKWSESRKTGGFLYFKENYAITCKNGYNLIDYVKTKFKNPNVEHNIIKNNFNKDWESKNTSTGNDFTDRYSSITVIGDKDINNVYVSFNRKFYIYTELCNFFKKNEKLVIPYSFDTTKTGETINVSVFKTAFNSFKNKLMELYNAKLKEINEENKNFTSDLDNSNKLSIYLTLKNLHDKHLANVLNEKEKYMLKDSNNDPDKISEFNRFSFIDTFYRDLSDSLLFNMSTLDEVLHAITNGEDMSKNNGINGSDMSVYSFMALLCEKHNLLFLSLPTFKGVFDRENGVENLKKMFTPLPFNESCNDQILRGPNYVCFYPHQPSKHLNIDGNQYGNDGFDINNTGNFEGSEEIEKLFEDDDSELIVPAFGIEYGSQKQSIFKSVNINMDNPQTTEVAVATQFNLVQKSSNEPRKLGFQGQDLFKIYSNYSYTCNVTMMGCMQIQPLMYFQLNNIPMFRGAYQIIHVEHDIRPGDITTTFKGVRINRNKIPLNNNCININTLLPNLTNNPNMEKNRFEIKEMDLNDAIFVSNNEPIGNIKEMDNINADTLINAFNDSIEFAPGKKESFDKLNPSLRRLMYCITKDIQEINEKSTNGDKLKLYITSATRETTYNDNSKSDHLIGGNASSQRKRLKGKYIDNSEKLYSDMGCAVDFYVKKNNVADKGDSTIMLFHKIALNYYEYIRQLIWENSANSTNTTNEISNCIHLASYGKGNYNDKQEIYVASGPDFSSIPMTELPSEFINLLLKLKEDKKYEIITFNNFSKPGNIHIFNKNKKDSTLYSFKTCDTDVLRNLYMYQLQLA